MVSTVFVFINPPESTATTMACEERSEHNHSRGGCLVHPSSSYRPKCSLKSHSRSLVTWLQRVGGGGCCFGWCHKVIISNL